MISRKKSCFALILIIIFTIFCGFETRKLQYGWVLEGGLPKFMEPQKEFDEILRKSPNWSTDTTVIGISNPNEYGIFDANFLRAISEITKDAKKILGFASVTSLSNYQKIKNIYLDGEPQIKTYKLLKKIPKNTEEMSVLKQDILDEPKLARFGGLVSPSLKSSVIVLELNTNMGKEGKNYDQKKITDWLNGTREKYEKKGFKVYFYGGASLRTHIDIELNRSMKINVALAVFIITFIAFLFFGFSVNLLVLFISGLISSFAIALGATALIGSKINVISIVGLVIAPATFGSYAIQFLARHFETENSVPQTTKEICFALLLSAFTSLCGFIPLSFVPLTALKDYSVFSSMAILAGLFLSLCFVPLFICVFPLKRKARKEIIINTKLEKALLSILEMKPKKIIIGMAILLLFSINIFRLEIRSNPSEFFPKEDELQKSLSFFRKEFKATGKISFIIDTGNKNPIRKSLLNKIEAIQTKMEQKGKVASSVSINEIIKIVNRVVAGDGNKRFYSIPEKDLVSKQLIEIFNSDMSDNYFAPFANQLKVDFWTEVADSKEIRNLYNELKKETMSLKNEGKILIYGDWVLWSFEDIAAVYAKLACVLLTCLLLLFVWFRFRDLEKTIFCLVPPMFSTLIMLGFMAMLGINLEIASAALVTIVFGLGADSPVHYFERHLILKNIRQTHLSIGKPLIVYAITIAAGFMSLVFSNLKPIQNLGLLIIAALFLNAGLTIFLTPHFLIWKENKEKNKEDGNDSKTRNTKQNILRKVASFVY